MTETQYWVQRYNFTGQYSFSNSAFVSFRSAVSNPSVIPL